MRNQTKQALTFVIKKFSNKLEWEEVDVNQGLAFKICGIRLCEVKQKYISDMKYVRCILNIAPNEVFTD